MAFWMLTSSVIGAQVEVVASQTAVLVFGAPVKAAPG